MGDPISRANAVRHLPPIDQKRFIELDDQPAARIPLVAPPSKKRLELVACVEPFLLPDLARIVADYALPTCQPDLKGTWAALDEILTIYMRAGPQKPRRIAEPASLDDSDDDIGGPFRQDDSGEKLEILRDELRETSDRMNGMLEHPSTTRVYRAHAKRLLRSLDRLRELTRDAPRVQPWIDAVGHGIEQQFPGLVLKHPQSWPAVVACLCSQAQADSPEPEVARMLAAVEKIARNPAQDDDRIEEDIAQFAREQLDVMRSWNASGISIGCSDACLDLVFPGWRVPGCEDLQGLAWLWKELVNQVGRPQVVTLPAIREQIKELIQELIKELIKELIASHGNAAVPARAQADLLCKRFEALTDEMAAAIEAWLVQGRIEMGNVDLLIEKFTERVASAVESVRAAVKGIRADRVAGLLKKLEKACEAVRAASEPQEAGGAVAGRVRSDSEELDWIVANAQKAFRFP